MGIYRSPGLSWRFVVWGGGFAGVAKHIYKRIPHTPEAKDAPYLVGVVRRVFVAVLSLHARYGHAEKLIFLTTQHKKRIFE